MRFLLSKLIPNKTQFLGSEIKKVEYQSAKVVVIPVPYECTTSYFKGTKLGPRKILAASHQLENFDTELNLKLPLTIFTLKELKFKYKNPEKDLLLIKSVVLAELENQKWPITLGGEHTITGPIIAAFKEYYQENEFGMIHFDAHFDLRDVYSDTKNSHATMLRRVRDQIKKTLSVGIRSFSEAEKQHAIEEKVLHILDKDLTLGIDFESYLDQLPQNIYLTLDLDFFSLAIFPGVGTPVPGGLDWWASLILIRKIFEAKNVIGLDVVELCPKVESKISSFNAAYLVAKCIMYKFAL